MSAITHTHAADLVGAANAALDIVGAAVYILQAVAAGITAFLGFFR